MFAIKRRLYEKSPQWVKRGIGAIPFQWIAGPSYRAVRRRGIELAGCDLTALSRFQEAALGAILEQATKEVPAYRHLRDAVLELPPTEALVQFPLLDKRALKEEFDRYLSTTVPAHRRWSSSTGGTTGDQLHFVLDDGAQYREMAFIHRLWAQLGYTPRARKATFRGVEFPHVSEGCYWQLNPVYNECQFSPYHLSGQTIPVYLRQLQSYRPEYIHGYPSAVAMLAEFLLQQDARVPVQGVLLGSEAVTAEQRARIERAFEAKVFSWYGHSERVILAGECLQTASFHSVPDYGWLEVVDEYGQPVEVGEVGELVGTGFWNTAMPLIRYRTGDRARLLSRDCPCGNPSMRFDRIEGRWKQEFAVGRSGARISVAALNMHGPFYDRVVRYQYYQNRPGVLELRLMAGEGFSDSDRTALKEAFRRRVNGELEVEVVLVDEIPLTSRGKLRRLIQEIPPEALDTLGQRSAGLESVL